MTITLEPELEQKIQEAATRAGQDVNGFVKEILLQKLEAQNDKEARKERLQQQARQMAADPLFLQDIAETMEAYKPIDSETARMMDTEDAR